MQKECPSYQTKHLKVRRRVKFFGKDTRNFKLVRGLFYGFMHKALCHREWKYYRLSFACRKHCQIDFLGRLWLYQLHMRIHFPEIGSFDSLLLLLFSKARSASFLYILFSKRPTLLLEMILFSPDKNLFGDFPGGLQVKIQCAVWPKKPTSVSNTMWYHLYEESKFFFKRSSL